MKTYLSRSVWFLPLAGLAFAVALSAAARGEEVKLKLLSSGATAKLGGYIPQRLLLSATQPAGLKKAPKDLASPLYGELKLGAKDSPTTFFVILDEPTGKPSRLWVDANANGDLTDDPEPEWTAHANKGKDGNELTTYMGGANVKLGTGADAAELKIDIYRFDKTDPGRAAFTNTLFYYGDYARVGEVAIGGKSYKAILADSWTSGDFRGEKDKQGGLVSLLLDLNDDGKFDRRREGFDVNKPFNIGGTTYEIKGMTASGSSFQIEKSAETVEETKPAPNLVSGKKALEFEAKQTDGATVKFPTTYKGKLVMLDFWATWCPPCRAEIPGLVKTYNKYHDKGFDVLGISLDQMNQGEKLAKFTEEYKMPWPQVYDGKYWTSKVAVQYNIDSIPQAFLVDGDTGQIVASGQNLRGENLDQTIETALAKKSGK
jgi:thiol-disulfide isomerase/thioredoxin